MKKVYLSLLAFGIAGTSLAQMTAKPHTFGELNTGKDVINAPALNNADQSKALGITVWSDNFDTPANWVIDNDGQTGAEFGWTIDATYDGWSTVGGPIASTSGGNFAELSNGNPTLATPTQALDVTYTLTLASALDIPNLPANTPNTDQVNLQYEQTGALFNDEQLTQISVDGGTTWITVRDNRDFHSVLSASGGAAYPNPETVSINLAPYIAGNASNVSIRFQWTTAYPSASTNPNVWVTYGWTLDDLKLITNPDNDIAAEMPYWGSVGLHYYQIPTAQVAPIDFTTNAYNNGLASQTNVTLDVDINSGAWTGSSAGSTIAPGAYDSLVCSTQYTPAASVGTHNVVWGVSQTEVDDVPGNNDNADINFDVTDFIYARDNGTVDGSTYNQGNGYEVGNLYDIFTAATIYSLDIGISSSAVVGASVFGILYSIDPTTGDFIVLDQTDYYTISAADQGSIITLPLLSGGWPLNANETYLVVAGTDGDGGTTDDIVISNAGDSDPQTSFFYDYTDLTWYYTTSTPIVRMNFENQAGIDELEGLNNVVLYPNPANDELNIDFSLDNAADINIAIVDLAGKTIATKSMNNTAKGTQTVGFNTTDFASGVYTVTIESTNGKLTRKFIKK